MTAVLPNMNHSAHTVACSVFSMNSILTQMSRPWVSNHSQVQLVDVARYVAAEDDLNEEHTDLGELVDATGWAFDNAAAFAISEPESVIFGHMPICWMISE